jgi:phospholipase C
VPLLVISAYTPAGYVDHNIHDFGSILHFVENNFSLGHIGPGGWADSFADDLSEFFIFGAPAREFVSIEARPLTRKEMKDHSEPDTD